MDKAYITSLHARGVGLFKELDIEFNEKFNFLVGPNGSGKTSILKCLALCFSGGQNVNQFRYTEDSEFWTELFYNGKTIRIGLGPRWARNFDQYQSAKIRNYTMPLIQDGIKGYKIRDLNQLDLPMVPLILGPYRRINYRKIEGMRRENNSIIQRQEYSSLGFSQLSGDTLPEVKQWFINRYFIIEKNWAEIEKKNWDWLIENLDKVGPIDSNLQYIGTKKDLEPIFSLYGIDCYLEELSAGYQAILSLIFKIFDWIEGTKEDESRLVVNAHGTVIIDELDIHLHPEWQYTIRKTLDIMFPNLQFITTTHSPHLISTAKSGEIIILPQMSRIIKVKPTKTVYAGWNTDDILKHVMGVISIENKLYYYLIEECLKWEREKNIIKLKESIKQLEEVTHPSDTIVSTLKIKLASLLLEGNENNKSN